MNTVPVCTLTICGCWHTNLKSGANLNRIVRAALVTQPERAYKVHDENLMKEPPGSMAIKCDKCSYIGSTNCAVKNHKLPMHNGDLKPWVCSFSGCVYRCAIKSELRKHQIIHETVPEFRNRYKCPLNTCAFRTGRKGDLREHVRRRHTVERTRDFECLMCQKSYFTLQSLQLHIRCHTREKAFKCNQCDHSACSSAALYSHVKKTHQDPVISSCSFPGCAYSTKLKT